MPRKPPVPAQAERISLSIQEVADQHGLHPKTVRRLVDRGELRAIRFGTAIRIPVSELERLLKGR